LNGLPRFGAEALLYPVAPVEGREGAQDPATQIDHGRRYGLSIFAGEPAFAVNVLKGGYLVVSSHPRSA
jgi:hypothetical protein